MPANSLSRIIHVFWKDGRKKPYSAYSNLKKFFDLNPDLPSMYNYKTLGNKFAQQDDLVFETDFIRIERLRINDGKNSTGADY